MWRCSPEVRKSGAMSWHCQQLCESSSPSHLIPLGFFSHRFNGRAGWLCSKMAQSLTFYSSVFWVDPKKPSEGPSVGDIAPWLVGLRSSAEFCWTQWGCIEFSSEPHTEQLLNQCLCEKSELLHFNSWGVGVEIVIII